MKPGACQVSYLQCWDLSEPPAPGKDKSSPDFTGDMLYPAARDPIMVTTTSQGRKIIEYY